MKNLVLSTEKLNDIMICPRLAFFKHMLRKVPASKDPNLQGGEYLHTALETFYRAKRNGETPPDDLVIEGIRNDLAGSSIPVADQENYVKQYRDYRSHPPIQGESWEILEVEKPFAKELFHTDEHRIIITGKADLIIKVDFGKGHKAIVDHKIRKSNRQEHGRDNQKLCYCWAFECRDFVVNQIGLQTSYAPDKRFKRFPFCYTDKQIEEWKEAAIYYSLEYIRHIETDYWPPRFTGCTIYGKKCSYYDVCDTTPDNRVYKLESEFKDKEDYKLEDKDAETNK